LKEAVERKSFSKRY